MISIKIISSKNALKYVLNDPDNIKLKLVQLMAWRHQASNH